MQKIYEKYFIKIYQKINEKIFTKNIYQKYM